MNDRSPAFPLRKAACNFLVAYAGDMRAHPPRLVPSLYDVLATNPRKMPHVTKSLPQNFVSKMARMARNSTILNDIYRFSQVPPYQRHLVVPLRQLVAPFEIVNDFGTVRTAQLHEEVVAVIHDVYHQGFHFSPQAE